ncbi:serine protease 1 [Drosophila busckii]|uniref:serine protease 1 n=1 Tax=Drosophila busckii TaxID=30019 RepID=UPI00083F289C|nr:serine protease 1 [Drosophila busckii]
MRVIAIFVVVLAVTTALENQVPWQDVSTDLKNSCKGDSGGPLVLSNGNVQVGIISFGSSAGCLSGAPKGLVRLTSYVHWIKEHTGIFY